MFLSFYTPTYRRPQSLARCLASVAAQTIVADIEHLVIPDHIGRGIGGMYAQIPQYAEAVHGDYVHVLADDDVLAAPDVCARVRVFAEAHQYPPVLLVSVTKAGAQWPQGEPWPPVCGQIDLGCLITRADVWKRHVTDYGQRYEGDWDFADALYRAGHRALCCDVMFLHGAVSRGAAEAA